MLTESKNFEDNAKLIEEECLKLVESICLDLDEYIRQVKRVLSDTQYEISASEMDSAMMNIPAMLYWVKAEKEKLGIRLDLALKVKEDKWNDAFLAAEGSVTEKKVYANSVTVQEAFNCIVYGRAYKMIDNREQMAFEVMQSLKKVASRRMGGFPG